MRRKIIIVVILVIAFSALAYSNSSDPFGVGKRGHWSIKAVPEAGYLENGVWEFGEGVVVRFRGQPVVRIGPEGISRFHFWNDEEPFKTDEEGRARVHY